MKNINKIAHGINDDLYNKTANDINLSIKMVRLYNFMFADYVPQEVWSWKFPAVIKNQIIDNRARLFE